MVLFSVAVLVFFSLYKRQEALVSACSFRAAAERAFDLELEALGSDAGRALGHHGISKPWRSRLWPGVIMSTFLRSLSGRNNHMRWCKCDVYGCGP